MTLTMERPAGRYGVQMTGVGLVLIREALDDTLTVALVQALGDPLADAGVRFVTRVVEDAEEELAVYPAWQRSGSVDAVALFGVGAADPRIPLLRDLGLPFAAVADASRADGYSAVVFDTAETLELVRAYLAETGRRRIVYIGGPEGASTPDSRAAAIAEKPGEPPIEVVRARPDEAVKAALDALAAPAARDAGSSVLLVDSDVVAVAVQAALREQGLRVPDDVAVLCWADSVLCQSARPAITAVNQRASELGALLGDCLLRAAASDAPVIVTAPKAFIAARESA